MLVGGARRREEGKVFENPPKNRGMRKGVWMPEEREDGGGKLASKIDPDGSGLFGRIQRTVSDRSREGRR